MASLTSFSVISSSIGLGTPPFDGNQFVSVSDLVNALRSVIRAIPVDEEWYCYAYPDVAQAIEAGDVKSATQHFVEHGYFEGRRPCQPKVDENWYLTTYPDVAEGIELGEFSSAQDHFDRYGYREGRFTTEQDAISNNLGLVGVRSQSPTAS